MDNETYFPRSLGEPCTCISFKGKDIYHARDTTYTAYYSPNNPTTKEMKNKTFKKHTKVIHQNDRHFLSTEQGCWLMLLKLVAQFFCSKRDLCNYKYMCNLFLWDTFVYRYIYMLIYWNCLYMYIVVIKYC